MLYAEIFILNPLSKVKTTFTYACPKNLSSNLKKGQLVQIPLRQKTYNGIVLKIHSQKPRFPTKEIIAILSPIPIITPKQFELSEFLQTHYFAPPYQTLSLFIPTYFQQLKKWPTPQTEIPPSSSQLKLNLTDKLSTTEEKIVQQLAQPNLQTTLFQPTFSIHQKEILLRLIHQNLKNQKTALIILPEIYLTQDWLKYFQDQLKEHLIPISTQLSPKKLALNWLKSQTQKNPVILGSRKALFAPLQNLGLIILIDEHDENFQSQATPRFHARELALQLQKIHQAKLILTSPTPSLESYHQVLQKKYNLIPSPPKTTKKTPTTPNSKIQIINLREEAKKGNYTLISDPLLTTIAKNFPTQTNSKTISSSNGKIVLFLNKRGGSSSLVCRDCGFTVPCPHCDQKMAFHADQKKLVCHLCGSKKDPPEACPICQNTQLKYSGLGTQKIEKTLQEKFPHLNILRVDQDQPLKKISPQVLEKTQVFIGTQKILPLLYQIKITLLSIILADISLNQPHYQSNFQAFQLFHRLINLNPTKTYIQTYKPNNPILKTLQTHDLQSFYKKELKNRQILNFPPFTSLYTLIYRHTDLRQTEREAQKTFRSLQKKLPSQTTLDISPAHPHKLKNEYRYQILVRGLKNPREITKIAREKNWKVL